MYKKFIILVAIIGMLLSVCALSKEKIKSKNVIECNLFSDVYLLDNGVSYRDIDLNLSGVDAQIIYHYFKETPVSTLLIFLGRKARVLSTREGFKQVEFVGIHYIHPNLFHDFGHRRSEYKEKLYADLKINPDNIAMLYTAVPIDNISIKTEIYDDLKFVVCVTAGVTNAMRAGTDKGKWLERDGEFEHIGTINIIILTNASLSEGVMVSSIITATEGKTAAFQEMDIKSYQNPDMLATGTGTDAIIVVSGTGQRITAIGGATKAGELLGRAVVSAVKDAICKQKLFLKQIKEKDLPKYR